MTSPPTLTNFHSPVSLLLGKKAAKKEAKALEIEN
jgi:hypothetical protein